jgi:hypothetical protein
MKFLIYPAAAIVALSMAGSAFAAQCEDRYQAMGPNRPHDWNAFQAQCELSSTGGGNGGAASGMAIPRPIQRPVASVDSATTGPAADSGALHESYERGRYRSSDRNVDGAIGQWSKAQGSLSDAHTGSAVGRSGTGTGSGGEAGARG